MTFNVQKPGSHGTVKCSLSERFICEMWKSLCVVVWNMGKVLWDIVLISTWWFPSVLTFCRSSWNVPITNHLRGRSGRTFDVINYLYTYNIIGLFDTHLRFNDASVNFYDILFWFWLQKLTTMYLNSYRNNVDIWNPCRTSMKKGQQWLQPGICRNLFLLVETTASTTLMLWTSSFASFSPPPSYGLLMVLLAWWDPFRRLPSMRSRRFH